MKRIVLYILVFLCQQSAFSQEIFDEDQNNVLGVWSKSIILKFDNKVLFFLYNFLEKDISEYYIRVNYGLFDEKQNHNFPCNSKLLFETVDGSVVELMAVMTEILPELGRYSYPIAFYPVTIAQLETLFKGVSHVKLDILKYDNMKKKVIRYNPEMKFKKDKLGDYLKKAYVGIEKIKREKYNY